MPRIQKSCRLVGAAAVSLLIGLAAPASADIEKGLAAYLRGDFATAHREYRRLAEQGDAAAQFGLGLLYHLGEGAARDHAEALRWYTEAAEQGEVRAQHTLGDMYRNGQGAPRDHAAAARWSRRRRLILA